jgi:PAS domain-containing protein
MRDITDRHAAEQKTNRKVNCKPYLTKHQMLIVIDDQQNIIRWNPKAEEVFGWTLDEVLGKLWGLIYLFMKRRTKTHKDTDNFLVTV